jgi:hypothetical protein
MSIDTLFVGATQCPDVFQFALSRQDRVVRLRKRNTKWNLMCASTDRGGGVMQQLHEFIHQVLMFQPCFCTKRKGRVSHFCFPSTAPTNAGLYRSVSSLSFQLYSGELFGLRIPGISRGSRCVPSEEGEGLHLVGF